MRPYYFPDEINLEEELVQIRALVGIIEMASTSEAFEGEDFQPIYYAANNAEQKLKSLLEKLSLRPIESQEVA